MILENDLLLSHSFLLGLINCDVAYTGLNVASVCLKVVHMYSFVAWI